MEMGRRPWHSTQRAEDAHIGEAGCEMGTKGYAHVAGDDEAEQQSRAEIKDSGQTRYEDQGRHACETRPCGGGSEEFNIAQSQSRPTAAKEINMPQQQDNRNCD